MDNGADGPTIYANVQENRVSEFVGPTEDFVKSYVASQLQGQATHIIQDALREVYRRGVIDGFAQGVAAESDGD